MDTKNNIYAMGVENARFMTNPTPKSDIRKVNIKDGVLAPLIEEHKKHPAQVTLLG